MSDILVTLADISKGRLVTEASDLLAQVTEAVAATGKNGKITLTVAVSPLKGADGTVQVKGNVTASVPKTDFASIFYVAEGGELTRDNPSMDPLFERAIS